MIVVFLKAFLNREPPVEPLFIIPGFVIGMIVALPLHELTHAVCYPKGATVWVGLCLRKLSAYGSTTLWSKRRNRFNYISASVFLTHDTFSLTVSDCAYLLDNTLTSWSKYIEWNFRGATDRRLARNDYSQKLTAGLSGEWRSFLCFTIIFTNLVTDRKNCPD